MATSRKLITGNDVHFVTLKLASSLKGDNGIELFNERLFCDDFIRSLIFCIDKYHLEIYGFVLLSDQVHLIVHALPEEVEGLIEHLMTKSENEILHTIGKKISMLKEVKSREEKNLRRFFSQMMNADLKSFWHSEHHALSLNHHTKKKDLIPIDAQLLIEHLSDEDRNYLQLGADAFTRLMMDSMKI